MKQKVVELTPQNVEKIRMITNQNWRGCQRKKYSIFAFWPEAGFIFANKLEQPLSYKVIMKINNGNPIIAERKLAAIPKAYEFVMKNGCYRTDGSRVVLCGTRGELWDVKPEKLASSYTNENDSPITSIPRNKWFVVNRASERYAQAVGIQLPIQILGIFKTSWALLRVNDLNSTGHGKGDILVAPKLPNGTLDYAHISPTNNEVFLLTYNQNVGGWNHSGHLAKPELVESLALETVKRNFKFMH